MSITLKVNETTHMVGIDQPMREVPPELGAPKVLEGFDARGQPKLRAAKRAITLRHLLTHTSAYTYGNWSDLLPQEITGTPDIAECKTAALPRSSSILVNVGSTASAWTSSAGLLKS